MPRLLLRPITAQYTPIPFQEMVAFAEMDEKKNLLKQKELADVSSKIDELDSEFSKIGAIRQDVELRDSRLKAYQTELGSLWEKYKNDPINLAQGVRKIQNSFNNDDLLANIKTRYATQITSFKEQDDAKKEYILKSGASGMSEDDYTLARQKETVDQESLVQDPNTGKWTTPSGILYRPIGAKYTPNIASKAVEYAKLITPESVTDLDPNLRKTNIPGVYYNVKTDREESFAQVRADLITQALKADPVIMNYYGWKNNITGREEQARNLTMSKFNELEKNNFITTDQQGLQTQHNPEYVASTLMEDYDKMIYPEIHQSAQAIGTLTQKRSYKSDISFMNLREKGGDGDKPVAAPSSLNVPYTQANTSVNNTVKNVESIAIPTRGTGMEDIPNAPRSGYNEFVGTRETPRVTEDDWANNYDNLSTLDKTRIDFVKEQIPELKGIPSKNFTVDQRKKLVDKLKTLENIKVSAEIKTIQDPKERVEQGKNYNTYMEYFAFYDPNNVIGVNPNRMYSGTQLRALGYKVDEQAGTLSSSNVVPLPIAGMAYTFAKPDVVNVSKADGTKGVQLYVGKNRAQIDDSYRLSAFENALSLSTNTQLPSALFGNEDIVVIPKGAYSFDIKSSTGETISLNAKNPTELRSLIINLYNTSPALQQIIEQSIFGE